MFSSGSSTSSAGTDASSWLQRARLPKPSPSDAGNRFTGDASTFKYAAPLQQPNASKLWPSIDRTGFLYHQNDSFVQHLPLYRQDEVEVLHFHAWTAFWSAVSSIAGGKLLFSTPSGTEVGQWAKQGGQRYLLENVREGLSAPGDWYWDEGANEVLLVPADAADRDGSANIGEGFVATAPQLAVLLEIDGASCVTLTDLEFAHADLPSTGRTNV